MACPYVPTSVGVCHGKPSPERRLELELLEPEILQLP
jgi:hypothetical protein